MAWHDHLCICFYFWNLKVQTVDSSALLKSQKWKWNQWYLLCIVQCAQGIIDLYALEINDIWHPSIKYLSQVPRWVLAQQEMPYPAYYRSDLKLNLMIILMSLISRQWPCDFFVRNDTARGSPSSQKRKHLRKNCFSNFSKMSFQR